MRTIRYTNQFKRDYKREKSGKSRQYSADVDKELMSIVRLLASDAPVPENKRIIRSEASGKTIAIATSGPISF